MTSVSVPDAGFSMTDKGKHGRDNNSGHFHASVNSTPVLLVVC